jgi:beta-lactamase regulating signal transducer with metallopeptidase domain
MPAVFLTAAGISWLGSAALGAALLLAASGLAALLLRRASAAARHQAWALGVVLALLFPVLSFIVPAPPRASVSTAPSPEPARALPATVGPWSAPGAAPRWPAWLALGWAAGSSLVGLRFLRGHLGARRLARRATPASAGAWLTARSDAAAALGLRGAVPLGRAESAISPMTIGVLRPRVLLPAAADGWSPARLRAVLLHELGHVRRRDPLVQLGAQLACALYWWNPLAWLAALRLRIERELACDDLVLQGGVRPSSYAADLLDIVRAWSPGADVRAIAMMDGAATEARLRRILDPSTPRRPLSARLRWAMAAGALALTMPLAMAASPPSLPRPAPGTAGEARLWLRTATVMTDVPEALLAAPAIDPAEVADVIGRHAGDLERCYRQSRASHPGLEGTVLVRWSILAGEVFEREVLLGTLNDVATRSCVEEVVKAARFPASTVKRVELTLPLYFGERPPLSEPEGC